MSSTGRAIRISVAGDIMLGSAADLPPADLSSAAGRLWSPMSGSHLTLVNLESPVTASAAPRANKQYNYRAAPEALALFDRRFVLGLANNHLMDFGESGLLDTLGELSSRGLVFAGAGRTLAEASRPAIVEAGGATVAVLCAADPRYQPAGPDRPGTCPATPDVLGPALSRARAAADVVVVSLHMGMEYIPVPTPYMQRMAAFCLAEGARLVVFHHAHCLSGHTRGAGGTVLWGTGNYVFPAGPSFTFDPHFDGAVWNVTLQLGDARGDSVRVVPIRLDADGLPSVAAGRDAERITRAVARWSARLASGRMLGIRRLLLLMRPSFLRANLPHYWEIGRRESLRGVFRSVASTIRTQLRSGRD